MTAYAHLTTDLHDLLASWPAPGEGQERLRRDYLAHLEQHPDAVAKSGPPTHFTASCLVLDPSGGQVLLTHHRRALTWFQFGGHLEPGDPTVLAAATREAREESGIPGLVLSPGVVQLDRHALSGDFGACREHLDVRYAAVASPEAVHRVSAESLDVRWWPVQALPDDTDPSLLHLVAAARRVVRAQPSFPPSPSAPSPSSSVSSPDASAIPSRNPRARSSRS